jgi:XTP/dITP diphosphohydrolase
MWLLATGNPHKVREIGEVLGAFGVSLERPADRGLTLDPEEWADTFAGNAVIKAIAFAEAAGVVCLADDSGLEVDALDGDPGVRSARFAGSPCDDDANNALLLERMRGVPAGERTARYRCVIAIAVPASTAPDVAPRSIEAFGPDDVGRVGDWVVRTFDGACEGVIGTEARGDGGFGYDPYFVLPDGRHMAELSGAEKHAISHRGAALYKLAAWLESQPGLAR